MTSSIGQQYLSRLMMIAEGSDSNNTQCLFCRSNISNDGVLCRDCMRKYTGGRMALKRDTISVSVAADDLVLTSSEVDQSKSVSRGVVQSKPISPEADQSKSASSNGQLRNLANGGAEIASKTVSKFANKVDKLAGGEGKAELKVRVLFSDVFKHHTSEEAERIFICGTASTTPGIKEIETSWPAPWLYSRVALWLLLVSP